MSTPNNSFNERFDSTEGSHIGSFFANEYQNYAVYKVLQRLPHVRDTLAGTQRKLITVLEKRPQNRKIKTAETYGMIYNETKYLHGDASAFTTSESMSRGSSNNINIFTEEGNFGTRTNRAAAGPRYTNTRFSYSARLLFPEIDKNILPQQEFEGKVIEPHFLLPILPVMLMNGQEAIAIGYASKFLPRDPEDIVNVMVQMLTKAKKGEVYSGMTPKSIDLKFPYYGGTIVKDSDETKSAWTLYGTLTKSKRKNYVQITDVPPSFTRETYLKKIKKLMDKGIIKSYSEKCVKNSFDFTMKLDPVVWEKSEIDIMRDIGLYETVVENFTFIDPNSVSPVMKFSDAEDYLKYFMEDRQYWYGVRKKYQLDTIQYDINVLENKIRFITEVNNGDIIITKRKKTDLEKELKDKEYLAIDQSYDYLLGIKLWNLTQESIPKHMEKIQQLKEERDTISNTSTEDMHIAELKAFKKSIAAEIKKKTLA